MMAVGIEDKEFKLRIEVVGRLILLFPTQSDRRALVLTPDEAETLSKNLVEAAERCRTGG